MGEFSFGYRGCFVSNLISPTNLIIIEIEIIDKLTEPTSLSAANGSTINMLGKVDLKLNIGGKIAIQQFLITNNVHQSILGIDAINRFNIIIKQGQYYV